MQDLLQSFEVLTPIGLIPAAIALVAGLMLWCAGQKFLKWAFAIIGLAIGAAIGLAIGAALGEGVPDWIPAIILALIAAIIAAVASRFFVTIALAVVLGVGFPALTWTIADATGKYSLPEVRSAPQTPEDAEPDDDEDGVEEEYDADWIREGLERLREMANAQSGDGDASSATSSLDEEDISNLTAEQLRQEFIEQAELLGMSPEEAQEQLELARTFLRELGDAARDIWDQAPAGLQRLLVVTSALGVLLGFVLGIFLPKLATGIVTSFGGAMLWMLALLTIAGGFGAPLAEWLPASVTIWIGAWLVISVIGLAIQWAAFRKKADKSE